MHYVVKNLIKYDPEYLDKKADDLYLDLVGWQSSAKQESGVMYGEMWTSERRTIQIADPGVRTYKYSGSSAGTTVGFQECQPVSEVRDALLKDTKVRYNFCLVNFYPVVFTDDETPDLQATPSLGWHSDDEKDMVPKAPIASISLGDVRRFRVRTKAGHEIVWDHKLDHGSLVIMEGECQELTQHCIWKMSKTDVKDGDVRFGLRINLTFRVMKVEK